MNIKLKALAPLAMLYLMTGQAYASGVCSSHPFFNSTTPIIVDLGTTSLEEGGKVEGSHGPGVILAKCDPHWGRILFRKYEVMRPLAGSRDAEGWQYLKINNSLEAAVMTMSKWGGLLYPPYQDSAGVTLTAAEIKEPLIINDYQYVVRLRVTKSAVGRVTIPPTTLIGVYVNNSEFPNTAGSIWSNQPIYTIGIAGTVEVKESCEIKGGELVIDFGEISPRAFGRVGAGNKANNVVVATKDIEIQCIGTNDTAKVSVRLTADKVQNDMLVSTNDDIGFKVSDKNDNILMPNNRNSKIPLQLNDSKSSVGIKVWPVSVTGNMPTPGPFKSRAMLNVDFE